MGKYLRDDLNFVLFSEIYDKFSSPKANREALGVLKTATDLFAEKGFHATTKAMIARKQGVSPAKISYYFDSLSEIKNYSIKFSRLLFQTYVIDEMQKKSTCSEKFESYFDCCIDWPEQYGKSRRLWISFLHQCCLDEELKSLNSEATQVGYMRLHRLIEVGVEAGEFNVSDVDRVSLLIHTMVTGLLLGCATEEKNEFWQHRVDEIKKGCLALLSPQ